MSDFNDLLPEKAGRWYDKMVELLARLTTITNALEGMSVTSATSLTPATGDLAFVTDQTATERPLAVGAVVRARSASDPAKFAVGTVTAFSGTALTINATLAAGAVAVDDWVIGYELAAVLSLLLDPAPQLGAALDAAGFGITNLATIVQTSGIAELRQLRVIVGDQWAVGDLGTVTTTQTVGPTTAPVAVVTLGADVNLDHAAPTAGYEFTKKWRVVQGAAGGWVPSFRASDGTAATWPNDDEPDWAGQDPAAETRLAAVVEGASTVRMFVGG